ncbi:MAG: helix-turn-helix domain-containing protein [Halobacteriota archaeon]
MKPKTLEAKVPLAPGVTKEVKGVNAMKFARCQRGLSQREIADMLGVTQATYSRTESGLTEPSTELRKKISDILGIPQYSLFEEVEITSETGVGKKRAELAPKDIPDMIRELKSLLDEGLITHTEFETKKKELLARL